MKRLTAIILSLMLTLTSVFSFAEGPDTPAPLTTEEAIAILVDALAEVLSGDKPGLDVTLTSPEGESVSAGFGLTADGASLHADMDGTAFLLTEQFACLTDVNGVAALPLETLAATMLAAATQGNPLPVPTDAELEAVLAMAQEFILGLMGSGVVNYSMSSNMLSLHADLDKLFTCLDTLLPAVVRSHAAEAESLLAKISPYLFGQTVPMDALLQAWSSLNLKDIRTGLTLDAVLFTSGDNLSLMASCMGFTLKADIGNTSLAFNLTAPNGVVYSFDTQDVLTALSIFSTVPDSITEDAIKFVQTTDYQQSSRYSVTNTSLTIDLAMLERDVKAGLTKAITANATVLDALFAKYQPMIQLLTGYASVNSSKLLSKLATIDLLPDWTGTLTAAYDNYSDIMKMSAQLSEDDEALALFDLYMDDVSLNAALRDADGEFSLTLTGVNDRYNTSFTLSCSEDLGGFNSITYATGYRGSYYNTYEAITTDTDIFHLLTDLNGVDLKLGDLSATFHADGLSAVWPNGYLEIAGNTNGIEIASPWFGLNIRDGRTAATVDGYVAETPNRPTSFRLMIDTENMYTLSILPYYGDSVHVIYRPGKLSILNSNQELALVDSGVNTPNQNTTLLTFDNEVMLTIVTEVEREEDFTIRVYEGADTTAPCWTLQIDVGAAGRNVPADAQTVTVEEFLTRFEALLNPPAEVPAVEENPVSTFPELDSLPDLDSDLLP